MGHGFVIEDENKAEPALEPIRPSRWIFCIGGFTQQLGERTGLQRLWMTLGRLRSPSTCVVLREWDADWPAMAEHVLRTSVQPSDCEILVFAYSYGAGHGFVRLARELRHRGLKITAAVLADPVYRHRCLLLRWLTACRWPVIAVPGNVAEVYSTRQETDWPRAHRLVAESPNKTVIHSPLLRELKHAWMDDDVMFQAIAMEVAGLC